MSNAAGFFIGTGHQLRDTAFAVLDAYYEAGGRDLDSARVYEDNEAIISAWLDSRGVRDEVRVLTKGGHPDLTGWVPPTSPPWEKPAPPAPQWKPRLSLADLRQDAHVSLTELGVETLDAYLLHRDHEAIPVDDVAAALGELASDGIARQFGVSNWRAERVGDLIASLDRQGGPKLSFVSNYFGLAHVVRPFIIEGETTTPSLIELAEHHDFRILAYMARSHGYFGETPPPISAAFDSPESQRRKEILLDVAKSAQADPAAVLIRWLVTVHPSITPVFGTRRTEAIVELARDADNDELDEAVSELTARVGSSWRDSGKFGPWGGTE